VGSPVNDRERIAGLLGDSDVIEVHSLATHVHVHPEQCWEAMVAAQQPSVVRKALAYLKPLDPRAWRRLKVAQRRVQRRGWRW